MVAETFAMIFQPQLFSSIFGVIKWDVHPPLRGEVGTSICSDPLILEKTQSSASTESIGCRLCTPERTVHYNQDPIYKCHGHRSADRSV